MVLAVYGGNAPVREDRRSIAGEPSRCAVRSRRRVRHAGDYDEVAHVAGQFIDGGRGIANEARLQQQVLRRIAGNRQFGADEDVRRLGASLPDPAAQTLDVAVQVADGQVRLAERDPEGCRHSRSQRSRMLPRGRSVRPIAPAISRTLAWIVRRFSGPTPINCFAAGERSSSVGSV